METSPKLGSYSYRFGAIAALITIVFSLIIYFLDFQNNNVVRLLTILIPTLVSVVAIFLFKSNQQNKIDVRDAVKISVGVFLICAILYQFYLAIFLNYTSNNQSSISTAFFNSLPPVLIKNIILGALIGLTTGLITKKN